MTEQIYKQLCETMKKRGGMFPGMDIPEFYELSQVLFTMEEAEISIALPRGFNTAAVIATVMKKKEEEIKAALEQMADKGLVISGKREDESVYAGPPFVPGIFEYQFMRGTSTERDKKIAKLIQNYKAALATYRPAPNHKELKAAIKQSLAS